VLTEIESQNGSPHSSIRKAPISAIIIHDTAGRTAHSALSWFARAESKVSAHVVIDRDGTIYRVVPDERAAWHAGVSQLHGNGNVNGLSLGVELVDVDNDPEFSYTPAQLHAVTLWCGFKSHEYAIPLNRIVGHDQVCLPHGRKVDPGADFPWVSFLQGVAGIVDTLS
jgi:N-acetylmuramoyl-L-alanine amidase